MPSSVEPRRSLSLSLRVKIAVISLLSLFLTTACSWLRLRSAEETDVMCYKVANPTDTPTPYVMCYEVSLPTDTPTSEHPDLLITPTCYTPTPPPLSSSHTPTPTLTLTPLCYTPTPSPTATSPDPAPLLPPAKVPTVTCYAYQADVEPLVPGAIDPIASIPSPDEARRLLLQDLVAEGRFPQDVAQRLGGRSHGKVSR